MAKRRDKEGERDLAVGRIRALVREAARQPASAGARADRYAGLALRIAERYQTGLPEDAKGRVCRSCGGFLVPGRTGRVRLTGGRVSTTCLRCGAVRRRPLGGKA